MNTFLRDMNLDMADRHIRCVAGLANCNPEHAGPMIDDSNWTDLGATYVLELLEAAMADDGYSQQGQQIIRGAMYNIEARAATQDVWDWLEARRQRQIDAVKVGDVVGFKCDIEQCGKVVEIYQSAAGPTFVLENEHGFSGHYLQGKTRTNELAKTCWVEE